MAALAVLAAAGCGGADAPAPRLRAVPQVDRTPPEAVLRFEHADGVETARSPVGPRPRPPLALRDPSVRLTAVGRDDDGATGRVRVSVRYDRVCRGRTQVVTRNFPPSQIERVRLAPGTRAPTQRRRTVSLSLDPGGAGCTAQGEAWADVTNAHGLEAFSDPIRFTYRRPD